MAEDKAEDNLGPVPDWLKEMPKSDLHCHIGGSMKIKTMMELADKYGVVLPAKSEEELRKLVVFKDRPERSLKSYLEGIKICESVLAHPDAFARVAREICEDASAEKVNILELRFAPTNYAKKTPARAAPLRLNEIMEATLSGIKEGAEKCKMHTGLIVCGMKTDIPATKMAAEMAVNYQDRGVVGFDMAGPEKGYRPKLFEEPIRQVLLNFLPVTIHAGEDDTVASIAEAIIYLNARRIGHGISCRESSKLFNYMDATRIGLETCLTSNVDTGAVASFETHPIRTYFKDTSNVVCNGASPDECERAKYLLRVSINTDNRTISDTNITNEYMRLMHHLGFTQDDVYRLAIHGIKSAFFTSDTMKSYLFNFNEYVRRQAKDSHLTEQQDLDCSEE